MATPARTKETLTKGYKKAQETGVEDARKSSKRLWSAKGSAVGQGERDESSESSRRKSRSSESEGERERAMESGEKAVEKGSDGRGVEFSLEEGDRKIGSQEGLKMADIAEAKRTARKLAKEKAQFEKELKMAKELAKRNAEEAERAKTKMIEAEKDLEIAMLKKKLKEARREQPGAKKDKGVEESEDVSVEEGKRCEAKTEKAYANVKLNTTGIMAVLEKSMAFADNEDNLKLELESWEEESEKEVQLVKGACMISPKRTGAGEQRVKRDSVMFEEVKQILSHGKDGIKMPFEESEWSDDYGIQLPKRRALEGDVDK